jgi:hypothetical protein
MANLLRWFARKLTAMRRNESAALRNNLRKIYSDGINAMRANSRTDATAVHNGLRETVNKIDPPR